MSNLKDNKNNLEILISTINKSSLDFINNILKNNIECLYPILVVNQSKNELKSNQNNIRVINLNSIGLSKSRNTAIQNSSSDLCIFCDDDIVYKENFYNTIKTAFKENIDADVITFQIENEHGQLFKDYDNLKYHNKKSIKKVNSVAIAFKRKSIVLNKIKFDSLFGLGSTFKTGDEYLFLRDCLKKNLKIIFVQKVILTHKSVSSGKLAEKDENIYARAAIFYKIFGKLSYLKLVHHIYLLKKKNMINFNQIFVKFMVGIKGIKKFKSIR